MKYFPLLRGKQNEMLALRDLAEEIALIGEVVPIIEPVRWNRNTIISINAFMDSDMRFVLVCNPALGEYSEDRPGLAGHITALDLMDYPNWVPAMYVRGGTRSVEIRQFLRTYRDFEVAFIYKGKPQQQAALGLITGANVAHHVFLLNRVEQEYIDTIRVDDRVMVRDPFVRAARNAEYPDRRFFTDMNTVAGNQDDVNFGDFSIAGDYYTDTGGAAHAVALHHIHFDRNSHRLMVSHFISDRRDMPVDVGGKTLEAINNLVRALPLVRPSDTNTCDEYRELGADRRYRSLGYMKRMAIRHHLEVMLNPRGLGH